MALMIDTGEKDGVRLDGLAFVVLVRSPGPMADGNITVGLIVDQRADDQQTAAIAAIASGAEGGPMAMLAPLVSRVVGIEKRPVSFDGDGLTFAVKAGELIDQACEGVPSLGRPDEQRVPRHRHGPPEEGGGTRVRRLEVRVLARHDRHLCAEGNDGAERRHDEHP